MRPSNMPLETIVHNRRALIECNVREASVSLVFLIRYHILLQAAQAAKAEAAPKAAGPTLDDDEGDIDPNQYHDRRVAGIKVSRR